VLSFNAFDVFNGPLVSQASVFTATSHYCVSESQKKLRVRPFGTKNAKRRSKCRPGLQRDYIYVGSGLQVYLLWD
jgi:hypothetical protein